MADPVGLIGGAGNIHPDNRFTPKPTPGDANGGASFKDVLLENLDQVNKLSDDATKAIEDLQTGKRDDVEGVILATQKADNAFRMLQAVRNKMVQAYEEVKQMRV
jgi:flagellar hook-basal body complex protein FliE